MAGRHDQESEPRARQLWLFPEEAPPAGSAGTDSLGEACARLHPERRVSITYTRNRTVILSMRRLADGLIKLRAHECFAECPEEVAGAVAMLYLGRPKRESRRRLQALVTRWHQRNARPAASPPANELDHGRIHHLPTILDIVNRSYFQGALDLDITYSARPARRTMGRHEVREPRSLILVNPILDHPLVKAWYLHYLVFHECLHEVIRPRVVQGKTLLHPPEFRRRESLHPHALEAREHERWITGPGHALLRAAWRQRMSQEQSSKTVMVTAARRSRLKRRERGPSDAGAP